MLSESEWIYERHNLFEVMQAHPEWGIRALARAVQHDPQWVTRWRKRLAGVADATLEVLHSQSRRPKHSPTALSAAVKDKVAELRETLSEQFYRPAGARLITYFYRKGLTSDEGVPSLSSIEKILRERGYIRHPVKAPPEPLVLPAPMEEWELDFGEIYLGPAEGTLEFLLVVDRGTSRVVYVEGSEGYRAESAIDAVMRSFSQHGLPKRLRFDRDPRLWGSWTRDSYPAPFVRLLRALGVEPIICPPRRPDLKPFVERCIRTLKHEWLAKYSPATFADAHTLLTPFIDYHNRLRPHQGDACQNRTPDEAFPRLPVLPALPDRIRLDAWLTAEHSRVYRRRINASGTFQVDQHVYYIGQNLAGTAVLVQLDAYRRQLLITLNGQLVKAVPLKGLHPGLTELWSAVEIIKSEARFVEAHHLATWHKPGDLEA